MAGLTEKVWTMEGTTTEEIPQEEWPAFCEHFSREHQGRRVSVFVHGDSVEVGSHALARDLALAGISADLAEAQEAPRLAIVAGRDSAARVERIVTRPSRLRLEKNGLIGYTALHIDAADGSTTVIRLEGIKAFQARQRGR